MDIEQLEHETNEAKIFQTRIDELASIGTPCVVSWSYNGNSYSIELNRTQENKLRKDLVEFYTGELSATEDNIKELVNNED